MQEKAMVSDALNTLNSGLKTYTDMISQTENQQLRSTLQQMRNEAETSQYELYTIAKNKNYYQPSQQASQNEINSLKSVFASNTNTGWTGNNSSMTNNSAMSGMSGTSAAGSSTMATNTSGNMTNSSLSGGSSGIGSMTDSGISGGSNLVGSSSGLTSGQDTFGSSR